jgi:hypothetical protein
MNICKEPKCVYSQYYKKCILPNPYIENISACKRKNIKKKDCKYNEIKEQVKANACRYYYKRIENKTNSLSKSKKDKLDKIKKNIQARKIANKFKKFINPFINRISAKIESRIEYYKELFKILNKINEEQCLNFINELNGKKQYSLGKNSEILLTEQIGTKSKYGIVYLSKINIQYKRLYKFAVKILLNNLNSRNEIRLVEKVSDLVIKNINPHFPILYKKFECIYHAHDSVNYPKLIINEKYYTMLTELANGDMEKFIIKPENHSDYKIMKNTLQQYLIAILSFHIHTNKIHTDAHIGNFLYHIIKPGGYIHYQIFGVDIYIENIGYLWIIWDYMTATINRVNGFDDYKKGIPYFHNYDEIYNNETSGELIKNIRGLVPKSDYEYNSKFNKLSFQIIELFKIKTFKPSNQPNEKQLWLNGFFKSPLFSKELVKPSDNEIINFGNPYVLNK